MTISKAFCNSFHHKETRANQVELALITITINLHFFELQWQHEVTFPLLEFVNHVKGLCQKLINLFALESLQIPESDFWTILLS